MHVNKSLTEIIAALPTLNKTQLLVKKGMRYRYYVVQRGDQDLEAAISAPNRIPAHELEKAVSSELKILLKSPDQVRDALAEPKEDLAMIHPSATQFGFARGQRPRFESK